MSNLELITNKHVDNSENKMEFETFKDLIMYYQTSIRNVALTTAVSFAALGYSRYYRGKSKLYAIGMCIVSLCILISSNIINYFLYNSLHQYRELEKFKNINELIIVNYLFMISHIIAILFGFYTLYRLILNKKFMNE